MDMRSEQQPLQQKVAQMKELLNLDKKRVYVSHNEMELQLQTLDKGSAEFLDGKFPTAVREYATAKALLTAKIAVIKEANRVKMATMTPQEYSALCCTLVNGNMLETLKALVQNGEYFGVGPRKQDVSSCLELALSAYIENGVTSLTHGTESLDYLCEILGENKFYQSQPRPTEFSGFDFDEAYYEFTVGGTRMMLNLS